MTTPEIKPEPCSMRESRAIITALLQQGETVTTVVHGNSMHPAIRSGETVTIAPVQQHPPRPGSIVLFPYADRLVMHRLIHQDPRTGQCRLAGDMHRRESESIPRAACIGIAVAVQRQAGPHKLDTPRARWLGLARYYLWPLRRILNRITR